MQQTIFIALGAYPVVRFTQADTGKPLGNGRVANNGLVTNYRTDNYCTVSHDTIKKLNLKNIAEVRFRMGEAPEIYLILPS